MLGACFWVYEGDAQFFNAICGEEKTVVELLVTDLTYTCHKPKSHHADMEECVRTAKVILPRCYETDEVLN